MKTKLFFQIFVAGLFLSITSIAQHPLPQPRYNHATAVTDTMAYFFGGLVDTSVHTGLKGYVEMCNDIIRLNLLDNTFDKPEQVNPPSPRYGSTINVVIDEEGHPCLVAWGGIGNDPNNYQRDLQVMDVNTITWTNKTSSVTGPLPSNVAFHASATENNIIYYYGGQQKYESGGQVWTFMSSDLFSYDVVANTFEYILVSNGQKRKKAGLVVKDNKAYCLGGYKENGEKTNEVYTADLSSPNPAWTLIQPQPGETVPTPFLGNDIVDVGDYNDPLNVINDVMVLLKTESDVNLYKFDLTNLEWGVHSIEWTSSDPGISDGIGSRYFNIPGVNKDNEEIIIHSFGGHDGNNNITNAYSKLCFGVDYFTLYTYDTTNTQWSYAAGTIPTVPNGFFFNYQAVLRDTIGQSLPDSTVTLRFTLSSTETPAVAEYTEEHSLTTNAFGMLICQLGYGTAITGSFDALTWNNTKYVVQVEIVDPVNGNTNMGTSELGYAPYAMHSATTADTTFTNLTVTDGDIRVTAPQSGIIIPSPDGKCWKVTVDNAGNISTVEVPCLD